MAFILVRTDLVLDSSTVPMSLGEIATLVGKTLCPLNWKMSRRLEK